MTKRRAESSSLPESPEKKKCRCVCDAERELEAVHALHAAAAPLPPALFTTLIGERRRKRPRCCEDREQHDGTVAAGHRLSNATDSVNELTGAVCASGKFRRASDACAHDMASEERASGLKPDEESAKVTRPDDCEDKLCAFNSFQFWRTPLPALDLSLLDSPSAPELNADSSLKDAAEEMET